MMARSGCKVHEGSPPCKETRNAATSSLSQDHTFLRVQSFRARGSKGICPAARGPHFSLFRSYEPICEKYGHPNRVARIC